jgi:hypothetical protein
MNELVDTPSSKITAEIRAQIVSGDLSVGVQGVGWSQG